MRSSEKRSSTWLKSMPRHVEQACADGRRSVWTGSAHPMLSRYGHITLATRQTLA